MMKVFLLVCSLQASFILAQVDYYDSRYDMFDIDFLVQNPRLLKKYIECFLDKGPCTPIGKVFKCFMVKENIMLKPVHILEAIQKRMCMKSTKCPSSTEKADYAITVLPEVISTACARCTPSQKRFARKTFEAFKRQLAESYDELLRSLDPNNIYYEKFEKAVASI